MKRIKVSRKDRNTDIGQHLITMLGEVIYSKPDIIVELGVRRGISTETLALAAELCNSRLISIDNRDCSKACDWDRWEFIESDSVEAGEKYHNGRIDVLFIDTYHSKPQVLKELETWIDKTNDNCLFIFHDTNPEWPKNIAIANEIGSILDGVNEFFGLKINKNGNHDDVFVNDKYIYYVTHHEYNEGMTFVRRMKK